MASSLDLASQNIRRQPISKPSKKAALKKPSALSQEFIHDSDSEEETRNSLGITGKVNTGNGKLLTPTISQVSTQATKSVPETKSRITATSKAISPFAESDTNVLDKSESSDSSKDFEQSSTEDDGEMENEKDDSTETEAISSAAKNQGVQNLNRVSSMYKPPDGFRRASASLENSSTVSTIFSPSNLFEKQLWHFVLPASMPLKALGKVSMQNLLDYEGVFSYKETEYNLVQAPEHEQITKNVLVPSKKGDEYRTVPTSLRRTLQLRHIPRLSKLCTNSKNPCGSSQEVNIPPKTYRKVIRQQPDGLMMRYRPFGDADDKMGVNGITSISSDEEIPTAEFEMPTRPDNTRLVTKRRIEDIDDSSGSPSKRQSKKRQKKIRVGSDSDRRDGIEVKSSIVEAQNLDARKGPINGDDPTTLHISNHVSLGVGKDHVKGDSEQKAKRKEEKRLKKQKRVENGRTVPSSETP